MNNQSLQSVKQTSSRYINIYEEILNYLFKKSKLIFSLSKILESKRSKDTSYTTPPYLVFAGVFKHCKNVLIPPSLPLLVDLISP